MCGWFHFRRIYKKTVILINEYDVPLDKAFQHGYYKEMVFLIRAMFGKALKTNDALAFAVLTGCLRVSKESIFTGLNNFKILSITDTRFDEQFGFTDAEVQKLLSDYHLENRFREVKEWYDGYRFGKADVYCPWDVINFVDRAKDDPEAKPEAYWINTSGNDGAWYYFNPVSDGKRGMMYAGQRTPDGYYVEKNGVWDGRNKQ